MFGDERPPGRAQGMPRRRFWFVLVVWLTLSGCAGPAAMLDLGGGRSDQGATPWPPEASATASRSPAASPTPAPTSTPTPTPVEPPSPTSTPSPTPTPIAKSTARVPVLM